jgi:5-methylcytosine-specific restriction enzyme A
MNNQIKKLQDFISQEVLDPGIKASLNSDATKALKATKTKLSHFKKVGDLYRYYVKVLKNGDGEEMDLYRALKENGLRTYEDIHGEIKSRFGNELYDVTSLRELKNNVPYSKIEICALANNFNQQTGMRTIQFDKTFEGFIAEIELGGESYPNEWIEVGKKLKYYPKIDKRYGLTKESKLASQYPNLPFYIFIKNFHANEVHYLYAGCFKVINSNLNIEKPFFILEVQSIRAQEVENSTEYDFSKILEDSRFLSLEELNQKISEWNFAPRVKYSYIKKQNRNPFIVEYVLRRAKGVCERCEKEGPFISRSTGMPFLEVHHITMLSENGEDSRANTIALCPNCHRQMHFGNIEEVEKNQLKLKIIKKME